MRVRAAFLAVILLQWERTSGFRLCNDEGKKERGKGPTSSANISLPYLQMMMQLCTVFRVFE